MDIVWAAGLFEGEGTVWAKKGPTGRSYLRISLATTDLDVLERFAAIVRATRIYKWTKPAGNQKQTYGVHVQGAQAVAIVSDQRFYSQLGNRRRSRIDEILEIVRTQRPRRYRGWDQTHCIHGHEFTPENTRVTRKGHRQCRTCDRLREARRRPRKR